MSATRVRQLYQVSEIRWSGRSTEHRQAQDEIFSIHLIPT